MREETVNVGMIKVVEEGRGEWGVEGRIARIGLFLSYQRFLRASIVFAEEWGVHRVY